MSSKASRTIVRDPRKPKRMPSRAVVTTESQKDAVDVPAHHQARPPMPFEPSVQNQQSLGLGSYMLAGAGVAMGVTLVGAIFGAIF